MTWTRMGLGRRKAHPRKDDNSSTSVGVPMLGALFYYEDGKTLVAEVTKETVVIYEAWQRHGISDCVEHDDDKYEHIIAKTRITDMRIF